MEHYWEVVVFYDIDYNLFNFIADELYDIGASRNSVANIYHTMYNGNGKAFTYSNIEKHISIVGFNKHDDYYDYLNSIVHEAEHIKQAMLEAYRVEDKGEPPAYTVGYLFVRMYKVFKELIA